MDQDFTYITRRPTYDAFNKESFGSPSHLIELLEKVNLNKRKDMTLAIESASNSALSLNNKAKSLPSPDAKPYFFDIETIPSVLVNVDGQDRAVRTPDIIWQYAAKDESGTRVVMNGLTKDQASLLRLKFDNGTFNYDTATREEKVAYDTLARIGKNANNMSSGGALEALTDADNKTKLIGRGIDYLSNNHQDGLNNIAREIDQHISSGTQVIGFNSQFFDVNKVSTALRESPDITRTLGTRAVNKIATKNHFDIFKTIKTAITLDPEAMSRAYKDSILRGAKQTKNGRLGAYYIKGSSLRQEDFARMLGIDVSKAHDAGADISALEQLYNNEYFRSYLESASKIIAENKSTMQEIKAGTFVSNINSVWGRNSGLLTFERNGGEYIFPEYNMRHVDGKNYTAYRGSTFKTNSVYEVSKVMKLDHNDLNLGRYIAENAGQLGINGSHDLHMIELTSGDGALRYIVGTKENLENQFMESFVPIAQRTKDGMQYNMPGMKIATNSLGIGMANTAEDTFNNLLVHSYQRQSRGNVIDKIQSATYSRENFVIDPIVSTFSTKKQQLAAATILQDHIELGKSVAEAMSGYSIEDLGGIDKGAFARSIEKIAAGMKERYNPEKGYIPSFGAVKEILNNINSKDNHFLISTAAREIAASGLEHDKIASDYVMQSVMNEYTRMIRNHEVSYDSRFRIDDKFLAGLAGPQNLSGVEFSLSLKEKDFNMAAATLEKKLRTYGTNKTITPTQLIDRFNYFATKLEKRGGALSNITKRFNDLKSQDDVSFRDMSEFFIRELQTYQQRNPHDEAFRSFDLTPGKAIITSDAQKTVLRSVAKSAANGLSKSPLDASQRLKGYLMNGLTEDMFVDRYKGLVPDKVLSARFNTIEKQMQGIANQIVASLGNNANLSIRGNTVAIVEGNKFYDISKYLSRVVYANGGNFAFQHGNSVVDMSFVERAVKSVHMDGSEAKVKPALQYVARELSNFDHILPSVKGWLKTDKNASIGEVLTNVLKNAQANPNKIGLSPGDKGFDVTKPELLRLSDLNIAQKNLIDHKAEIMRSLPELFNTNVLTVDHFVKMGVVEQGAGRDDVINFFKTINPAWDGKTGDLFKDMAPSSKSQNAINALLNPKDPSKGLNAVLHDEDFIERNFVGVDTYDFKYDDNGKIILNDDGTLKTSTRYSGSEYSILSDTEYEEQNITKSETNHYAKVLKGAKRYDTATNASAISPGNERSYQQSSGQSRTLLKEGVKQVALDHGDDPARYYTDKSWIGSTKADTNKAVLNTNTLLLQHDKEGQEIIDKSFNEIVTSIENEYHRTLSSNEVDKLYGEYSRALKSGIEGSAKISPELADALGQATYGLHGGEAINLAGNKDISKEFIERHVPIKINADGKFELKEVSDAVFLRGQDIVETSMDTEFSGATSKTAKSDLFGRIHFVDADNNIVSESKISKMLQELSVQNKPDDIKGMIDALKSKGIDTRMVLHNFRDTTRKLFVGNAKQTTSTLGFGLGEVDKNIAKILNETGFGNMVGLKFDTEGIAKFLSGDLNEIAYRYYSGDKDQRAQNLKEMRKRLLLEVGLIQNASKEEAYSAIKKRINIERNVIVNALAKTVNHGSPIDIIQGEQEMVKRKDIVGLTQQWLDNIADEPMDVKRAFMRKAVDNLNESGSIELFNKGAIYFDEKLNRIMFTDGVYEIKDGKNLGDIFKIMLKDQDEKLVQKLSDVDKLTMGVSGKVTAQQVTAYSKDYIGELQHAVFNQNELMKVRELKVGAGTAKELLKVIDPTGTLQESLAATGVYDNITGEINYGEKLSDAAMNGTRYSRAARKSRQKLAQAGDFADTSLEKFVYDLFDEKGIKATKDYVEEFAERLSHHAADYRNNKGGRMADDTKDFADIIAGSRGTDKEREVFKKALNDIDAPLTLDEMINHYKKTGEYKSGKFSETIGGRKYEMFIPQSAHSPETRAQVKSFFDSAQKLAEMEVQDGVQYTEEATKLKNNMDEAYNSLRDNVTKNLRGKGHILESTSSAYLGESIQAAATNVFDFDENFISSRKFAGGMTIKEAQKAGLSTSFGEASIDVFEKLGVFDGLDAAGRAAKIKQLETEGMAMGVGRYPFDYPTSVDFGKLYLNKGLAENEVRTNQLMAKGKGLDYDGDQIKLIKMNEDIITNSGMTDDNLLLASSMDNSAVTFQETTRRSYDPSTKTVSDVTIEGADGNTLAKTQKASSYAGETYNPLKNLQKVVNDVGFNEEFMTQYSGGMRLGHTASTVAIGVQEARLSAKNAGSATADIMNQFADVFTDLTRHGQTAEDIRNMGRLVTDDTYNKTIWSEMKRKQESLSTMVDAVANNSDFIANSGLQGRSAEEIQGAADEYVRQQYKQYISNMFETTASYMEKNKLNLNFTMSQLDLGVSVTGDRHATFRSATDAHSASQEAIINNAALNNMAPIVNNPEEQIQAVKMNESLIGSGVAERMAKLRSGEVKAMDIVRKARSKSVLGAMAALGSSILVAGYGSASPIPDVDNTPAQQINNSNTSVRLVQPQQGAANGGYIINVATSTSQDPQAAVAALNAMPNIVGSGGSATVTTRVTSKYEDMNANDISNYLDSVL